jgi:hypothetical protein
VLPIADRNCVLGNVKIDVVIETPDLIVLTSTGFAYSLAAVAVLYYSVLPCHAVLCSYNRQSRENKASIIT